MSASLVGSEMCIRDSPSVALHTAGWNEDAGTDQRGRRAEQRVLWLPQKHDEMLPPPRLR
eukprot:401549-Alexandrium_andersonii.AAC.1